MCLGPALQEHFTDNPQSALLTDDRSLVIASDMPLAYQTFQKEHSGEILRFYRRLVDSANLAAWDNLSSAARRLPPPFVKEALAKI
jgi:hypothetical protein